MSDKPNGNGVLSQVGLAPQPNLEGELLYKLQAAWWKQQTALAQLGNAERFYRESQQELAAAVDEVDHALNVHIGQTHDLNPNNWQIIARPQSMV